MKKFYFIFTLLICLVQGTAQIWADSASVGEVLWGENFAHFGTNTPSTAGSGTGTNVWAGSVAYTQSSTNTKGYDANLAGGTSPELLLAKSNTTWSIGGIPTGGATKMALTFKSNKTTFDVTTETANLTISGSEKSWTIIVDEGKDTPETFSLIIKNTGSQNARIDDVKLVVVTAAAGADVVVKTLKSISVSGMTTTYELNDDFSFDGTCTATYSVTKNDVAQDDEQKEVIPTTVSEPDMTSIGEKTVTVTYTEGEGGSAISKTAEYNITITAATPKIKIDGSATGITDTDGAQTITAGDGSFAGSFKQYSTTALWFTSGTGYIYNTASFGYIRKITINYKSGGAAAAIQWISLGSSALNSYAQDNTHGVKYTTSTGGTSNTFVVDGDYEFFRISVSSKNLQASSIVIEYDNSTSAPKAATPTFTAGDESFLTSTSVALSCETDGAVIHYTLDGTDPSASSATYSAPIAISATTTVKAIATADGMDNSSIAEKTFTKTAILTVAEARAAIDAGGDLTNKYVTGTISQIDSYNSTYKSIQYWISDDGTTTDQLEVYSGKGLNGADFSAITDLNVGDEVTVNGTLKKYQSTYEFDKNNYIVARKPIAALSWSETSYMAEIGGSNSFPTLSKPEGITVTYSSSNTSAATINASGVVSLVAAGETTITASFAGNDSYKANTASYTLTVATAVVRGDITYNVDGGSAIASETQQTNLPDELPTTTKAGKNFGGWFTDANKTVPAVAGAAIDGDITLYAKWLDPYTVAEALAMINALADNASTESQVYVSGKISQVDSYSSTYNSITYWISADGTTTNQLEVYSGLIGNATTALSKDAFSAKEDLQVGDQVVVYGTLKKYVKNSTTTPEFDKNNTIYSFSRSEVAVTGVELTESTAEVEVGGTVTLHASVVPSNATNKTIVWSVQSGSDKASVADGVVTGVAAGTAVIRATSEADNTKYAECTVTVNAVDPNAKKVSFDATSDKTAEDTEKSITKSDVTIAITSGDGRFNNSSEYRIYKNAVFEVSCSAGNITKIEFTCKSGNPMSGFAEATGLDITNSVWTGNATSVSLTASNKQVQITQLIVTYKEDNRAEAGLAWNSASDIVLTVGDAFNAPSLTNPHDVTVSVESDNTELATVTAGIVSLVADATGTATITATFAGDDDYKPATVSYTITVNSATPVATGDTYTKVTSSADITAGEYILVYEGESETLVWSGLDAVNGYVSASVSNNSIAIPEGAVSLTLAAVDGGYSILINGGDNNGKYVGQTSDANGMSIGETAHANSISIDADGNAVIVSGGAYLRYNASNNQNRFRYYKSSSYTGQKAIQLYKKASATPVELELEEIRTVEVGQWGTFCHEQTVEHPTGATFYTIALVKMQGDVPVHVFFDEIGEDESLEAGRPYVFIANSTALRGVLSGTTVNSGSNDNGFIGFLSDHTFQVTSSDANRYYVIYENQIRLCSGGWYKLLAGRAYIDIQDPNLPKEGSAAPAPGRRRICLSNPNAAPQVATGVDALTNDDKAVKVIINNTMYIIRNGQMYDTTGQLVK